jgi:3-oxoadipate enol-lactonase
MKVNPIGTTTPAHFVRTGPRGGTPIVFIHALGLDLSVWEYQIQEFGRDHDVIGFDLPGHGLSEPPLAKPSLPLFAQTLHDFLAELGTGPVDVVGISVGGMVAQMLAVTAPTVVRSLTLVATSCTFTEEVRGILRKRAQVAREGGMETLTPLHLERWFSADFRAKRPEVLDRFSKILLRQSNHYHADMWDMVTTLDLEQQLARVTCPVLVVAGQDDASAPPAAGQLIADRVPGAVLHVLPRCGHFPPIEYPAEFNALFRDFLSVWAPPLRMH